MIQLQGVGVSLGRRAVLRGLDLSLPAGALTAVVGPNGAGKSTLLRAIAGELRYRGGIQVNGLEVAGCDPQRMAAQRAVLPQRPELAFAFSVRQLVQLGASSGAQAAAATVDQALAAVGMLGAADSLYPQLSGGEQQRVQLARVLAQVWAPVTEDGRPCWLFLDEPVAALDLRHQLELMQLARDYARRGGGVLVVLHDLNLTAMFADHALLLRRGELLASGPVATTLNDPQLSAAYGCEVHVDTPPSDGGRYLLPQAVRLGDRPTITD